MLPAIAAIVSSLIANNLPKLAQGVVDKGLDYVEGKLGVKLEPDMPPEKVAELQLKSQEHEEFMIEQDNKNTADARDMQKVALQQDDLFSKRFVYYFALFWSVFTCLYIGGITFLDIPLSNIRFADIILGFLLGTIAATIINFFFGTSASSKQKTEAMVDIMRGK